MLRRTTAKVLVVVAVTVVAAVVVVPVAIDGSSRHGVGAICAFAIISECVDFSTGDGPVRQELVALLTLLRALWLLQGTVVGVVMVRRLQEAPSHRLFSRDPVC